MPQQQNRAPKSNYFKDILAKELAKYTGRVNNESVAEAFSNDVNRLIKQFQDENELILSEGGRIVNGVKVTIGPWGNPSVALLSTRRPR